MRYKSVVALITLSVFVATSTLFAQTGSSRKEKKEKLRKDIQEIVMSDVAYGDYYRSFVFSHLQHGDKVIVPESSMRYLEGYVVLEEPGGTRCSSEDQRDLNNQIESLAQTMSHPQAKDELKNFAQRAPEQEKLKFIETTDRFYLPSYYSSAYVAVGEDEDEKKNCREACDTVCTCAAKKVCEWVCEDTGLLKPKCRKKCSTICEEKCKEVCYKVCD